MKLSLSIALFLSCVVYSISAASISGGIEMNDKGVVQGKVAVNDQVGGVNVGAGVQGNNQREIKVEAGAGQNGHSAKVNYNQSPGSKSFGPTGTINLHHSDTSTIDATVSHTKNEQNGFKFEENSGSLNYADKAGNQAGVSMSHIPGIKDTFSQSASVNVLNTDNHNVQLDAHRTETKYNNGPRVESFGGKATYDNVNGHGAFVSANHVPIAHTTNINAGGKANLFTSNDKSTTLDFTAGAQQSRSPVGIRTQGAAGLQLQVRMPAPPPPARPAPFIPPPPPAPVRLPPLAPVAPPPPPPKKIDRSDPRNSPFYYEGCNHCCWGQKKWSTTCALPDDYD
ncbi:AttA.2 family protein [Megaselia abdita]